MSGCYLLDTNTASYIIKGNVPGVRERLLRVSAADALISVTLPSTRVAVIPGSLSCAVVADV